MPPPKKSTEDAAKNMGADLRQFLDIGMSYAPSRILSAGLQLRVFSAMAGGARTADEIAAATQTNPRAMGLLLDGLAALNFIAKSGGAYELTEGAREYLVRENPNYIGHMLETDALWNSWGKLADVVRAGEPEFRVDEKSKAEEFFPILVRSLHVTNGPAARKLGAHLAKTCPGHVSALDVGCGSGIWGISLAEANPAMRVTYQDFPGVLETTRGYVERHKVADRAAYLAGDLNEVDFGSYQFDIVLLGNILHSEGEESSRRLLKKLGRATRSGGRCVVIELVPNEERTGPAPAIIFALNMLVNTTRGGVYTLKEYSAWLAEAGFPRVETVEIGSVSPVIIGVKE